MVLAAATLWGTTGTAQALGPDGINPETVAAVRMAGGALLIGVAVRRRATAPWSAYRGAPFAWAIVAMASSQPLFFSGVERTGVAVGTIVTIGSGPILAGLLAWVVRGEAPGRKWAVATVVAVGGAVLLVSGGEAAGVDPAGLLFALSSGVMWAVYLVSAKSLFETHPPIFMAGVVFAGAAVLLAPLVFIEDVSWMTSGSGLLTALWLSIIATAASYVLFSTGLGSTPVAVAATLTLAEPLTAAVLGMAVLDEPARLSTIAGIGLIALGLTILSKPSDTARP